MGRLEERKQTAVRIFLLNSLKVIHVFKSVIVGIVVFAFFLIIFIFNSLFFLKKKVYTLLGEIEYAKERHRKLSEEKQHEKPFPLKPKS